MFFFPDVGDSDDNQHCWVWAILLYRGEQLSRKVKRKINQHPANKDWRTWLWRSQIKSDRQSSHSKGLIDRSEFLSATSFPFQVLQPRTREMAESELWHKTVAGPNLKTSKKVLQPPNPKFKEFVNWCQFGGDLSAEFFKAANRQLKLIEIIHSIYYIQYD